MNNELHGIHVATTASMIEAEAAVRTELAREGFGVLTEIDVAETLRDKLGIERGPYRILGACNPGLAAEALDIDPRVGLLLPCNITIHKSDDRTSVTVVDPMMLVQLSGNSSLMPIAVEAGRKLENVVTALVGRPGWEGELT
jgi:uncharacterized protein (DUF302 family)